MGSYTIPVTEVVYVPDRSSIEFLVKKWQEYNHGINGDFLNRLLLCGCFSHLFFFLTPLGLWLSTPQQTLGWSEPAGASTNPAQADDHVHTDDLFTLAWLLDHPIVSKVLRPPTMLCLSWGYSPQPLILYHAALLYEFPPYSAWVCLPKLRSSPM